LEDKNLPPEIAGWDCSLWPLYYLIPNKYIKFAPMKEAVIKGELSEVYKIPVVGVTINGILYEAAIDTCSYYCLLKREFLNIVPKQLLFEKEIALPGKIELKQVWGIPFNIEGRNVGGAFAEMSNIDFPYPVILGTLFLQQCKSLTYYSSENRFELVI